MNTPPHHTPGPWSIETLEGYHWIGASGAGNIAAIRRPLVGDMDANAHLIAAAPELLDTLEFVKERIEHMPMRGVIVDVHYKITETLNHVRGKFGGERPTKTLNEELLSLLQDILLQHDTNGAYSSHGEVSLSKSMRNRIFYTLNRVGKGVWGFSNHGQ